MSKNTKMTDFFQPTFINQSSDGKRQSTNYPKKQIMPEEAPQTNSVILIEDNQSQHTAELPDHPASDPCQLLYITPNHITQQWRKSKEFLNSMCAQHQLKSFNVQDTCETLFKLHFNMGNQMSKKVIFTNLKAAIDQMEEKAELLNGAIQSAAKLVMKMDLLFGEFVQILEKDVSNQVVLSRDQCACLIFCQFFCVVHLQPDHMKFSRHFMMAKLFQTEMAVDRQKNKVQKIKCILNYLLQHHRKQLGDGQVVYERRVLNKQDRSRVFPGTRQLQDDCISSAEWKCSSARLCPTIIKSQGRIEDQPYSVQVDFADKYIGGGVLADGCVQEEILFLVYPELIPSVLFTQVLQRNEALYVTGLKKVNRYSGYAQTFQYEGNANQQEPIDMICIDARNYKGQDQWLQYTEAEINGELTKAFVGFGDGKGQKLSTGRWGCGIFQGDWQLKFCIQWIAASVGGYADMVFYNVGSGDDMDKQKERLEFMLPLIGHLQAGQLYNIVQQWASGHMNNSIPERIDLLEYLMLVG